MSTTLTPAERIVEIADRAASREVDALADFYGLGVLIHTDKVTYDVARDSLAAAFTERNLAASTAKVYVSQGYALAQLFPTFADVEAFADDECKGSRSLKRIYDATRVKADKAEPVTGEGEGEGEGAQTATVVTDADRAASILSILGAMTDASAIASVRDAAAAMLTPAIVGAA